MEHIMTTIQMTNAKQRVAVGLMAIAIALGGLSVFVNSFAQDAEAVAQRRQVLATKAEQAREYRDLREGRVQVATSNGITVTGAMTN